MKTRDKSFLDNVADLVCGVLPTHLKTFLAECKKQSVQEILGQLVEFRKFMPSNSVLISQRCITTVCEYSYLHGLHM